MKFWPNLKHSPKNSLVAMMLLSLLMLAGLSSQPAHAKFISADPVTALQHLQNGNVQGFTPYVYANNNPYKFTDPDGRNPKLIADFALNVGLNYVTTGQANLAGAAKETISGALNPLKTVEKAQKLRKIYITYTKTNLKTGEVYTGRTSGVGEATQIVKKRDSGHHKNKDGFGAAEIDESSESRAAIRGREQQLIDANGGAKSQGGSSGNAINGISDKNPKKQSYIDAANKEFN